MRFFQDSSRSSASKSRFSAPYGPMGNPGSRNQMFMNQLAENSAFQLFLFVQLIVALDSPNT